MSFKTGSKGKFAAIKPSSDEIQLEDLEAIEMMVCSRSKLFEGWLRMRVTLRDMGPRYFISGLRRHTDGSRSHLVMARSGKNLAG
jgi:hypothetical protein